MHFTGCNNTLQQLSSYYYWCKHTNIKYKMQNKSRQIVEELQYLDIPKTNQWRRISSFKTGFDTVKSSHIYVNLWDCQDWLQDGHMDRFLQGTTTYNLLASSTRGTDCWYAMHVYQQIMHNNISLSRTPWIDWTNNNANYSIIRTIKSPTQIQDDH